VIVNDAVVDISEYMKVTCITLNRWHTCAACMDTAILSKLLHENAPAVLASHLQHIIIHVCVHDLVLCHNTRFIPEAQRSVYGAISHMLHKHVHICIRTDAHFHCVNLQYCMLLKQVRLCCTVVIVCLTTDNAVVIAAAPLMALLTCVINTMLHYPIGCQQILKESVGTNVTREILGHSGIDQGVFKQAHKHR
jgi:hypothetical protein